MPFSEKTINDFILSDGIKYESHVRYFADYISNIDEQKRVFSNGIWTDLVIESINQFIIEKGISSKARAKHYRTGLRNYFNYLLEKGVIRNSEFKLELAEGNSSKNSFLSKTNYFIENHPQLKENVSFNPYTDKDMSLLLSKCRELMDHQSKNQKKTYNDMLFAMVINFVYCFGTKYSVLRNIKINDLNFKYNYLYINGIKVHLNEKILDDLEKYINIRNNIKSESDV
ncbi:hypothetical protein [Exiguobacterium sp. SH3S1]|uniref:hypothetical protein n=1 Tax=Exiguobacterium sp. SH3S1 TaxID=2510955 RepID=UPI0010403129|nr:hypothetical protein [Exiguobacterium sp. SH3S1]TCI61823.1 hypothetical protein EVJ26_09685 [Exiguobacterium sp. SH3S1]